MNLQPEVLNMDCMEAMKGFPDNFFDLGIIDPEYGLNEGKRHSYHPNASTKYKPKNWDINAAGQDYFFELFRVTKNQIIWGANYYTDYLPARNSWIVWDKMKDFESVNMAEGELAWTSFNIPLRIIRRVWNGFQTSEPRHGEHPHEKPTGLYRWQLEKYAKAGNKILDTHGGSFSIALACQDYNFDLTVCEIDKGYYEAGIKRFKNHIAQQKLFV